MAYKLTYSSESLRQLKKLDRPIVKRIALYLDEVALLDQPRDRGKGLVGNRQGIWRYRIGDYRVMCQIDDGELTILAIVIAHRSTAYEG